MANWPDDKDLESFFQHGNEKHDFPLDTEAWDQMEKLLDRDKRRRRLFWIFRLGALSLLVLAVVLFSNADVRTYFFNNSLSEPSTSTFNIQNKYAPIVSSVIEQSLSSDASVMTIRQEQLPFKANDAQRINASSSGDIQEKRTADPPIAPPLRLTINNGMNRTDPRITLDSAIDQKYINEAPKDFVSKALLGNQSTLKIEDVNIDLPNIIDIVRLPSLRISSLLTTSLPEPLLERIKYPSEVSTETKANWDIGVQLGAETSWTPHGEFSDIDLVVGLSVGRHLGQRWILSSRLVYIADRYITGKDDYNPTKPFFESGMLPETIDARFNMFELQLGGSYHFKSTYSSGLFVSGFLNSNFILKESYSYRFEDHRADFKSSWAQSDNTVLSSISLAAGYRIVLPNGARLNISPYLKIPINPIGHGNAMLSAYGFGATYFLK